MHPNQLESLAAKLGGLLLKRGLRVSTAESCTGGWIAQVITSVAGSSQWFDLGLITYSNSAKHESLGVSTSLLEEHGAVSEPVVLAMAEGALATSGADISIAVSGIAGPDGGTKAKPVGTVWIGWGRKGAATQSEEFLFSGDREDIRYQTVVAAISRLISDLESA